MMFKTGLTISALVLLFYHLGFSQETKPENTDCLTIEEFQTKCKNGILNIKSYLNDSILSDSDHQNIMYCYNQLHWDIIGESIDRLIYRDSTNGENNSSLSDLRFNAHQFNQLSALFDDYKLIYWEYIDSEKLKFTSSYGLGGALYIDRLKTYPSTANGKTYFIICD